MTDEEKAEEIIKEKYCNNCEERETFPDIYNCSDKEHCDDYSLLKEGILLGLAEGRKEAFPEAVIKNLKENTSVINTVIMGKLSEKCEQLAKENNSIKQILINLVTAFNNYECAGPEQEQENTWETLRDLMHEELLKIENGEIAK